MRRRRSAVLATLILAGCSGLTGAPVPASASPASGLGLSASYLRGINSTTFEWYGGYGQYAGNEVWQSFAFMKAHGVDVIRIPVHWERLQSSLGGALNSSELARLKAEVSTASDQGIKAIIDLHNYGRYKQGAQELRLGAGITTAQFKDVWTRLANEFKDFPGVAAYDLMNEPYDLDGSSTSDTRADAVIWEQYSQAAVDAIRATGDSHPLAVEGVQSAGVGTFAALHPTAWINDPLNKVAYSAHQYFDYFGQYTEQPYSNVGVDYRYSTWKARYDAAHPGSTVSFNDAELNDLRSWIHWLETNKAEGYIGEVGWPAREVMVRSGMSQADANTETDSWNGLARKWFQLADTAGLSVTYFSASGVQQDGYLPNLHLPERNAVFVHGAGNGDIADASGNCVVDTWNHCQPQPIDTAYSQYEVLSQHPSR